MPDRLQYLKQARAIWQQVRGFGLLWLALTSLGGFVVLVGGPWVMTWLTTLFGPRAAHPGWVIFLLMLFTLPFTIYFWIQQRRLEENTVQCPQCGERHSKANSSCPMCGTARPKADSSQAKKTDKTVATKS